MSIASKLAELVIKKGGTLAADEDSVEEILAKLIELEDGGGGEGSGAFIIDCTVSYEDDEDEEGVYAIDKTLEEINAAYNAGQALLLKLTVMRDGERSDEIDWYYLSYAGDSYYQFQGPVDFGFLSCQYIGIGDNDGLYIESWHDSANPPGLTTVIGVYAGHGTDWSSGPNLTWDYDGEDLFAYLFDLIAQYRPVIVRGSLYGGRFFDFSLISAATTHLVFGACEYQIQIDGTTILFFNGVTLNSDGTSAAYRYQITGT